MKIGPTTQDRAILGVRALLPEDLGKLKEKRDPNNLIKRLRDPHHLLARCLASGMKIGDAARASGYTREGVHLLNKDPTFLNLVEHYRGIVTDEWRQGLDSFNELATANMLKAERQIAEKLEAADEAGETLPTRELIAISRDAADRLGYGKKQTNLNVNVDFAARLEACISRSGKTLDARASPAAALAPPPAGVRRDVAPLLEPQPGRIARRA